MNNDTGNTEVEICEYCGKIGHTKAECPFSVCGICGSFLHIVRDCPFKIIYVHPPHNGKMCTYKVDLVSNSITRVVATESDAVIMELIDDNVYEYLFDNNIDEGIVNTEYEIMKDVIARIGISKNLDKNPDYSKEPQKIQKAILLFRKPKGKRYSYSEEERFKTVKDWFCNDSKTITLEEFLESRFGNEGGIARVSPRTFYDWKDKFVEEEKIKFT